MLEEYLDGPEVDVDLVLSDGQPVYGAITDNWPTVEPYFNETGRLLLQASPGGSGGPAAAYKAAWCNFEHLLVLSKGQRHHRQLAHRGALLQQDGRI